MSRLAFCSAPAIRDALVCAIVLLSALPATPDELLLRCNYGIVTFGARVDLDGSTVTLVYDHGETEHHSARITSDFIRFTSGAWNVRINRITEAVVADHVSIANFTLTGRCAKAGGF
jgi:hypothetical protein